MLIRRLLPVAILIAAFTGAQAGSGLRWTDLEGKPFELESLRDAIVVLNFWATWCKPCVEEMSELEAVQRRWGERDVRVLGAAADAPEQAAAVRRFAEKRGVSFPLVLGATTRQMESVGLEPTLPGTVLLGRDRGIVRRYDGVLDRGELEADLQSLVEGTLEAEEAISAVEEEEKEAAHAHAHDHTSSSEASLVPS
jgi:thiol-disulfide isomerase/thioredoxin